MFWRRKSDGFDWHKHVRTTIKLRREDRRRRLDGAKDLAIGGVKDAGRAGIAASVSGLDTLNRTITSPIAWVGHMISTGLSKSLQSLTRIAGPGARIWERGSIAPMLGFAAIIAGLLGLGRASAQGWDHVALGMSIGALAILTYLIVPPLLTGKGPATLTRISSGLSSFMQRMPLLKGLSLQAQRVTTATLLLAGLAGGGWFAANALIANLPASTLASLPGLSRPVLQGSARATSGDTLRLSGQILRLSGIEAPETDQQCGGQGKEKRWRCGAAAQTALQEILRDKPVTCDLQGTNDKGQKLATCKAGKIDIAADLAGRGHVFAQAGLFSSYGRQEQDARNAKLGVWRGSAERPQEYRSRIWEAAKKAAPEGCPIKGHISGNERLYAVPWSTSYSRIKVRQDKGGRWFCSEGEALAAGWKPVERS